MSHIFTFPSALILTTNLWQHQATNKLTPSLLSNKKIIEAIAEFFGGKKNQEALDIDMGISYTLHDLNEKLNIPRLGLLIIHLNLTQALKDCAGGKKMELKKAVTNIQQDIKKNNDC